TLARAKAGEFAVELEPHGAGAEAALEGRQALALLLADRMRGGDGEDVVGGEVGLPALVLVDVEEDHDSGSAGVSASIARWRSTVSPVRRISVRLKSGMPMPSAVVSRATTSVPSSARRNS